MSMNDKYKYMFMKYLYNKIGLKEVENRLLSSGIKTLDFGSYDISKYFTLVNRVNYMALTGNLKEKYDYYFSLSIEELCSSSMQDELNKFFDETYKILLFPNVDDKYVYYGPINYNYMVPRDSIVLGFYHNEFDLDGDNFDEEHFMNEQLICDNLNFIQYELGPKINMKIAVIKYNEYYNINSIIKRL